MIRNYLYLLCAITCISSVLFSFTSYNELHHEEIDLEKSTVSWTGKKVTGSHEGTIRLKSGKLSYERTSWSGGEFVMDMQSILCTDLQGKKANSLVSHLKSPDFFDVENHGEAKFIIRSVERLRGTYYTVKGDLTIKGITKPIQFMTLKEDNSVSADITIDRTAYDIKYGSGSFFDDLGDKAIDNEFQLKANLVLK